MRVATDCRLEALELHGTGPESDTTWGYDKGALLEVGRPGACVFEVAMVGVLVQGMELSSGMRVRGGARVCMTDCSVSECKSMGFTMLVRSLEQVLFIFSIPGINPFPCFVSVF